MEPRVAIVTCTSSGIGAALAAALLGEGWDVLGISRRPVALADPRYAHRVADLGDVSALTGFIDAQLLPRLAAKPWSRVGLVNNAASLGGLRLLAELPPEDLAGIYAINAVAPVALMGALLRSVPRATPLRIVNVSSGAAHHGIAGAGDYCSSKAALRLAGMSLAEELEPGRDVAVFSYEPGVVETAMQVAARSASPDTFPAQPMFAGFKADGRLNAPEAVLGPMLDFLAGPAESRFVESRFGA